MFVGIECIGVQVTKTTAVQSGEQRSRSNHDRPEVLRRQLQPATVDGSARTGKCVNSCVWSPLGSRVLFVFSDLSLPDGRCVARHAKAKCQLGTSLPRYILTHPSLNRPQQRWRHRRPLHAHTPKTSTTSAKTDVTLVCVGRVEMKIYCICSSWSHSGSILFLTILLSLPVSCLLCSWLSKIYFTHHLTHGKHGMSF